MTTDGSDWGLIVSIQTQGLERLERSTIVWDPAAAVTAAAVSVGVVGVADSRIERQTDKGLAVNRIKRGERDWKHSTVTGVTV